MQRIWVRESIEQGRKTQRLFKRGRDRDKDRDSDRGRDKGPEKRSNLD
jgi:hypothetical protein